ncbi:hypothetical protein EVAR_87370_1 [Eumeta japonica]|uniref:Uncharacterized protein n=1 Tax=Eumeta variegata TaxID=151549 RepID=A0A4C1XYJ5_EUMVA|nr:hypothetical protein EVAR_87370_1 [Eumeta japonica]
MRVNTCYRPARALATSSVQYSNSRGREKERYTKIEIMREKENLFRNPNFFRAFNPGSDIIVHINSGHALDSNADLTTSSTPIPFSILLLPRSTSIVETAYGSSLYKNRLAGSDTALYFTSPLGLALLRLLPFGPASARRPQREDGARSYALFST